MKNSLIIKKLNRFFEENPDELGEKNTLEDIIYIEKVLDLHLNELYKEIICNFGSCFLGLPIYSLHINEELGNENIIELTNWFRDLASQNKKSDKYLNYLAFSHDGTGNYILILPDNNDLYIFNHEEGIIEDFDNKLDKLILDYIEE